MTTAPPPAPTHAAARALLAEHNGALLTRATLDPRVAVSRIGEDHWRITCLETGARLDVWGVTGVTTREGISQVILAWEDRVMTWERAVREVAK